MQVLTIDNEDIAAVVELLRASGLPVDDLHGTVFANFRKVMDASGIAGVAGIELLDADDALLRSLAVRGDCRGRGLGRILTAELECLAQTLGRARLYLLTDTAERFFSALGYATVPRHAVPPSVARTAQFSSLCPASAVCMRKELEVRKNPRAHEAA